ncbi:MAG: hypothetical protein SF029_13640 [bacterium]|nr:hypothetical protein [bacterium]
MVTFHLNGQITEDGEIRIDVPDGVQLPPGEVRVTLEMVTNQTAEAPDEIPWEELPWTDEELAQLLKIEPKTGAEIVAWLKSQPRSGWEDIGMTGAEWVEEQRRKRREQRGW